MRTVAFDASVTWFELRVAGLAIESRPLEELRRYIRPMPVPGLYISPELAATFFGFFSRFEFAMKEVGYRERRGRTNDAHPNWNRFALDIGRPLQILPNSDLSKAVKALTLHPPKVQIINQHDGLDWEARGLGGTNEGENAVRATCRVRNNLFHGGKQNPERYVGHDKLLVESSLVVLEACLEKHDGLRNVFNSP